MPARIGNPAHRRRHFIREWRNARHYSQEQLAELVGTTKATISRIEDLSQGYTQDGLEAIADALGVHPSVLISRPPRPDEGMASVLAAATAHKPKGKKGNPRH